MVEWVDNIEWDKREGENEERRMGRKRGGKMTNGEEPQGRKPESTRYGLRMRQIPKKNKIQG